MANQRLFATNEDALVQGGSGNDTIGGYTGKFSATTIKGVDGKDWIYLGNSETAITVSGSMDAAYTAGETRTLTASFVGSNWSAGSFQSRDTAVMTFTGGDLETSVIFTALTNSGAETIQRSLIAGGAGNDTISFGAAVTYFSGNTIGGGAGDDLIGSFGSSNDTAGVINTGFLGTQVKGGKGNDTIEFDISGAADGSGFLLNGNSGADSIRFSAISLLSDGKIAGGKGADTIDFVASGATGITVKGGEGSDQVTISETVKTTQSFLELDGSGQTGNDTILLTLSAGSGNTIAGGAGNDSIVFSALDAGVNDLVKAGKGNDFIVIATASANFDGTTIQGGQGNDSISMADSTNAMFNTGLIKLGAGDDTISFAATMADKTAGMAGTTIEGGAGADKITVSGVNSAGSATFLYSSLSESTSASMDTITFSKNAGDRAAAIGSAQVNFKISHDVILANGSGVSSQSGVTAVSGRIVFSSVDNDLETRISKIDAGFATTGTVGIFTVDGTDRFVFVQGGATDAVIKITDSAVMSAGQNSGVSIFKSGTTFGF